MKKGTLLNMVASQCPAGDEDKFNKWYNEVHIPMIFKFPGMKGVTRAKIVTEQEGLANYITIVEFENEKAFAEYEKSKELAAAREEMKGSWPQGFPRKWRAQYQVVKAWQK